MVGVARIDRRSPALVAGLTLDGGAPTRIGIQSTDRLRRESLAAHLDSLPQFSVVGRVARYEDVVSLCVLERPAIVLLDAGLEVSEAVAGCQQIADRSPEVCLAVLYGQLTPQQLSQFRGIGVDALVPYAHGLAGLVEVLRKLAAGMSRWQAASAGLSRRQREVLLLLASGHSAAEIADLLGISPGTVESHKRQVYAKLGVTSALQAVARAASFGLMDDDQAADEAAGAGAGSLPVPAAGWLPTVEPGRALVTVVTGGHEETIARVVTTLVGHGLPVLRDQAPSWTEPMHALRWHRGQIARVLADPGPDHWRVAAASWRRTVVVRSRHFRTTAVGTFANGGAALLMIDHVEDFLVPVLMLVTHGYLVMDRSFGQPFEHSDRPRFAGGELQQPTLTAREYDILAAIGRSLTIRQTARKLGIAVKTVENTQVHLFRKLGVHSRAEALAAAYSLGLLRPDSTA